MNDVQKIENLIEQLCKKYDDCEYSSLALKEDGFETNEAEVTCVPRFVNDYEVNYFSDDSQVYDFIDDFVEYCDVDTANINMIEPIDDEDYFVIIITW